LQTVPMSHLTGSNRCDKLGRGRREGKCIFCQRRGTAAKTRQDDITRQFTIASSTSIADSLPHIVASRTYIVATLYLTEAVRSLAGDFFTLPTTTSLHSQKDRQVRSSGVKKSAFFVSMQDARLLRPLDPIKTQSLVECDDGWSGFVSADLQGFQPTSICLVYQRCQ
jgi:hypothetical protein